MAAPAPAEATRLLLAFSAGDAGALNELMPLVYRELRALAGRVLRRHRGGQTLDATALVHEAYLRLVDQDCVRWEHRTHFYGVAARTMRSILVDHARRRGAAKRGGGWSRMTLENAARTEGQDGVDLLALDEALGRLAEFDAQQSRIVELRFFGGLTIEEVAAVLGISPATVKRDWTVARAWLRREIEG